MYKICTKYGNLYKEQKVVGFGNSLFFSLWAVLSACHIFTTLEDDYHNSKLGSGCNLDKDLRKDEGDNQLVKHKDIG